MSFNACVLPYSVVASSVDALPLSCRFSGRYFAATVHYSCPVNTLPSVLLALIGSLPLPLHVSFPVDTWPLWFLSSGYFTAVVVSASLADAWPPSRLVLSLEDT
jgi:hypothetical protein